MYNSSASSEHLFDDVILRMRPRISPGDEPPFHELDEYRFQKLCRDLHAKESGIASALVYGVRGEPQQGIDVRARRTRSEEIEVGQCKRYKHFDPAQIREASDEFFAHWDYWQTQHVKRFILFVTADIDSRKHIAVIDEQRLRFQEVGIEYETWAPDRIQSKLSEHPNIVAMYLKPPAYWVEAICGVTGPSPWRHMLPPAPASTAGSTNYYLQQIEVLASRLSLETERQLEEKRTAWREGRKDDARVWLYQAKSDQAIWERLWEAVRARVLRFEARVELDLTGNTYLATQLADEAHRLAPDAPDKVLQSYIALYDQDIETALALVADDDTVESANMQAMLLLHQGKVEEARGILERIVAFLEPNAETYRLYALLHFVTRDIAQAQLAARRALALGPNWESMRLTVAIVDYYSALSSVVLPAGIPVTPEPVDWGFVKQDDASLSDLRAAATTFGDLADLAYDSTTRRKHLIWRLAALANDPEGQSDALALCQGLLNNKPDDEAVLFWIIARGYPVDHKPGEKAIERRIRIGEASLNDVIVLLECRIANKEIERARSLLKRTRPLFDQNQSLWETWDLQLRVLKGERNAIAAAMAPQDQTTMSLRLKSLALHTNARRMGDWQPLREHLEQCVEITGDAGYLLELCDLLARQAQWDALADRAERLIAAVGTPVAVRLAVFGLFNSGRYVVCLEITILALLTTATRRAVGQGWRRLPDAETADATS